MLFEETPAPGNNLLSRLETLQCFVVSRTKDFVYLAWRIAEHSCATGWVVNWSSL